MDPKLLLVMTTVEDLGQAERLARELVEKRLAACVSLGEPVTSIYPWEGKIETGREVPMSIKTTAERLEDLKQAFAELHPYDVPEMLVLPVVDGLKPYFDWARDWMNDDD